MKVTYTTADLIAFEDEIAALFAEKRIHAPVHLAGGNESQLIRIFEEHVNPDDWVLCSWRSHYHCLLKGVPPEQLRQAILDGKSISLCFPEHRILSSGIVGGTAPIAVGLAMGIKRKQSGMVQRAMDDLPITFGELLNSQRKIVCFLGDMTAETGIVHESIKYAAGFDLPILWVIEDNGLSVSTNTEEVWGGRHYYSGTVIRRNLPVNVESNVVRYRYTLTRPHVGIGTHVAF